MEFSYSCYIAREKVIVCNSSSSSSNSCMYQQLLTDIYNTTS